jgi:hypothetical protein
MKLKAALSCLVLSLIPFAAAQDLANRPAVTMAAPNGAGKAPNADAMYQALRTIGLSSESSSANNLVIKRDAGEFTFRTGVFQFLNPVNGKVTGAVFLGDGSFSMVPPIASEKRSVYLLTKEPAVHEDFSAVVLRFTDDTYNEIKKAGGTSSSNGSGLGELESVKHALRRNLHYNLDARILEDVLSPEPGGLFYAFIKGKKYDGKEIFAVDPHGVHDVEPEEVMFATWSEMKSGIWAAFHGSSEYKDGSANGNERNGPIAITQQKLDTQIEKSGKLNGDAQTKIVALQDGVQVVPLDLFATLRVSSVSTATGDQLNFIQEDKNDDADFSVILPKPLNKGDSFWLRTVYSGKDAVSNEGGGNYYPVARSNWYPNTNEGNYSDYDMTFKIPKNMMMVATGTQLKATNEGDQNVSEWKSEVPQIRAGFSFGLFKHLEAKDKDFGAESYANENPPDWVRSITAQTDMMGNMNTTQLLKRSIAEAQVAMKIYSDYFGVNPYKHVQMTQQTACTYGQSWPTLVWMPICSFFDTTVRHNLGLDNSDRGYWQVVGPHEIAHQWWGSTVGWNSYRDQWMSEGFAEMSASIFLQAAYNNQKFIEFWKDERDLLTQKNREGFRANDVGPLTMGYRLDNAKVGGSIYRRLIYPKGGYVLHMLRMMMWDRQKGDTDFRDMMRDFVATYSGRAASTEDFKAMVEKHMTPSMDLDGNHKMDWYFNEYVYGTDLPTYSVDSSWDANMNLKLKITQSNVSPNFKMPVPVYLELANGNIVKLGTVPVTGNNSTEQTVPLGNALKEKPKRVLINYYNDILASAQ